MLSKKGYLEGGREGFLFLSQKKNFKNIFLKKL
jgi:hypothetical protein